MTSEAAAVGRKAKTVVYVLVAASAAMLVLAGAIVWAELRTEPVWDPLGDYPTQDVASRVPGVRGPATTINGTVDVRATKCNDTNAEVAVSTELSWRSVDPRGTSWTRGTSLSSRPPGCESLYFENVIPPEVRALIRTQHASGEPEPVWSIAGTETPVRDDGADGVPQRWQTENFVVVAAP